MKLTTNQEFHKTSAYRADQAYRKGKVEVFARHKLLAEQELEALAHERDRAIRRAHDAGVPVKQLAQALTTTATVTVYDSLRRTEGMAEQFTEAEELLPDRFEWANEEHSTVRITLAGTEWDALKAGMKPRLRKNHDKDSAVYKINEDGDFIPRVDWTDRTKESVYDHPVSAWVLFHEGLTEAESWIAAN